MTKLCLLVQSLKIMDKKSSLDFGPTAPALEAEMLYHMQTLLYLFSFWEESELLCFEDDMQVTSPS